MGEAAAENAAVTEEELFDSSQKDGYTRYMATISVKLPEELVRAAKVSPQSASEEIAKMLALELFRERVISMGKAAELCGVSVEEFMEFASRREVPLHYELEDLESDRKVADSLKL